MTEGQKRRSYEYYVVVRNLGRESEEFVHRTTDKAIAAKLLDSTKINKGDTKYLCRLNVIEKIEEV